MVSLYSLIIFFFILVIVYATVSLALSAHGWCCKRWLARKRIASSDALRVIDERTDRLKAKAFNITVVLVLFCITPFVILYLMVWP